MAEQKVDLYIIADETMLMKVMTIQDREARIGDEMLEVVKS